MRTVIVSAAIGSLVSGILAVIPKVWRRVVAGARRRFRSDHSALMRGDGWSTNATSAGERVRVLVCGAPSRSLRAGDIDPDQAIPFLRTAFGKHFLPEPVFSMPGYGVRFEAPDGAQAGYAWLHASGRVDLCVEVATTSIESGAIEVEATDLLRPLLELRDAMTAPAYWDSLRGRYRVRRRRFDWAVAVSPTVVVPGRGNVSWDALRFPNAVPDRAGTSQGAFCPPSGYAASELRSWRLHQPVERLLRVVLRDMLRQNGYHNAERTIEETLAVLGGTDAPASHAAPTAAVTGTAGGSATSGAENVRHKAS